MILPTLATVLVSFAFVGLCAWVLWPSNKSRLEEYGSIPLRDDPPPGDRKGGAHGARHDVPQVKGSRQ